MGVWVVGQLAAAAFTAYDPNTATSIVPGQFALYTVGVNSISPTQMNEGFSEVNYKTAGFDNLASSALDAYLQTYIEPVVIGPGGALYLLDGHHTFTALKNSIYGASNPTVYVNVVANYSSLTTAQFWTQMQAANTVLALNGGVPQSIDPATGLPIPTSLTALTNDPYRGLEYSILKNKSALLFTTAANLTGAIGASTPGLDKMTGFYSDFIWAAAYRNALGGAALPYLSPGDIALATQWNLKGSNTTTIPGTGSVTVAQLPGYILAANIAISGTISDSTLSTGTIDGNGGFTGITSFAFGSITLGTPRVGLVLQLGADKGFTVTLTGTNTYTGGTTLLAGTLIIGSDAALGAAAPTDYTIDPANIAASVRAANGIIFNSLTEGNATLAIGVTAGDGTSSVANSGTTNRPFAIDGETATFNPNGHYITLTGQIVSLGANGVGIGNTTGVSDFTINDTSASANGTVVLAPSTGSNAQFYGNWNLIAGTLSVSSDAALGNTTVPVAELGQIELNGGTFQTTASFSSARSFFLQSGSYFDTDGNTTSWSGTVTDVQRGLTVINTSTTSAGAVTFGSFNFGSTALLQLNPGTAGLTVTLTNGLVRMGAATLLIQPLASSVLGSASLKLLAGTAPTVTNGIVSPWAISDAGAVTNPYSFLTYGSNGYVNATASQTGGGSTGGIRVSSATDTVSQTSSATLAVAARAYALTVNSGVTITATGQTLTLGDGTNAAGLILQGGNITGGTLAFGGSEGVIYSSGTDSVSAAITGTKGLTFAGSGTVTLGAASTASGAITLDSGGLTLGVANVFANNTTGLYLSDSKKPTKATLTFSTSQSFSALSSAGNNSVVNFSNSAVLTIGNTTTNLSSTLSSSITETGTAVTGALTINTGGLVDLTGISTGKLVLVAGSTIAVSAGKLRVVAKSIKNGNAISVASGAEVQFSSNGGDVWAGNVTGSGAERLVSGTLKVTSTGNTYTGGTYVEVGSTLDLTTANVSSGNANITLDGGTVVFDQSTNGIYSGLISDGAELSGSGTQLPGTLIKDDSTGGNAGVLQLTRPQNYTGATYIEAGSIELASDALYNSSGVTLGRVGGGSAASLIVDSTSEIKSLISVAGNNTSVVLNGGSLIIQGPGSSNFGGVIKEVGNYVGVVFIATPQTVTFSGANTFRGGVVIAQGTFEVGNAAAAGSGAIQFGNNTVSGKPLAEVLKIDSGITISNTIKGFLTGDIIDLAGVTFSSTGSASLGAGNLLTVSENGSTYTLQLDPTANYSGQLFHVASDGSGGIDITEQNALPVASVTTLSGGYVNAAGDSAVAFAVSNMIAGDTGTVTFTDHNGATVKVAVTSAQSSYTTNLSGLADGTITVTSTLVGNAGSVSDGSFTLDTAAPVVAITLGGGLINSATQVISGTVDVADAGTTVTVYEGSTALGTATVLSDGTWTTSVTLSGDGPHTLVAKDTDAAGNTGTSAPVSYTLDTAAPVVAITSAGGLTNQASQTVSGTVDLADAGTTVTVYEGSSALGTATVGGDGKWSTSVTLSDDGSHTLVAKDTDAAGNTGSSTAVSYTLDRAPPVQVINYTSQPSGATKNADLSISGSVFTSEAPVGTVTIYDGSAVVGTASVDVHGGWSAALTLAGQGLHTVVVEATDAAGNSTITGVGNYMLDTIAPVVAITSPGGLTNSATQTISGTVDVADAGTTVTVYEGSTSLGTATVGADGTWSTTVTLAGEGAHTLVARDTDAAGNTGSSGTISYTLDSIAPVAPTGLADAAIIAGYIDLTHDTATQSLTGTAEVGSVVTIYDGTTRLGTANANAVTGVWSYGLGKLSDGSHSLTATATDTAGNTGPASSALAFIVDTAPIAAPSALADAAIVNGYVGTGHDTASQTVTGKAPAGSTVTVYANGTLLGTATANATTGLWSYKIGHLASGAYAVTATATNTLGQTSVPSTALSFIVRDTAVPAPTGLNDSAAIGGFVNVARNTAGQVLTGTAQNGSIVTIYANGVKLGTTTTAITTDDGGTSAWSYTLGTLVTGRYRLIATATDIAGNISPASTALIVKVFAAAPAAPKALADAVALNGYVNAAHDKKGQVITGTAALGTIISLYDNGTLVGTANTNSSGVWHYKIGILPEGSHTFTATASDAAGNTGPASSALTFTVDVTASIPAVINVTTDATAKTATLTGTTAAGEKISVYDFGSLIGTTTADGTGAWSYTSSVSALPSHHFAVSSTDAAGNVGRTTGTTYLNTRTGVTITGGAGNDILLGGPGDTLTGAAGNDTFVFHAGFGTETVTDFTPDTGAGGDHLQFDASLFADWAHLLGATTQVGSDLAITLDSTDVLTLKNVALASFTQSSVHLV